MRLPRIIMGRYIIIEEASEALDHDALRQQLEIEGCGAIVSFLGITRGNEGGAEVYALEFDAWQEKFTAWKAANPDKAKMLQDVAALGNQGCGWTRAGGRDGVTMLSRRSCDVAAMRSRRCHHAVATPDVSTVSQQRRKDLASPRFCEPWFPGAVIGPQM